ncbi:MAG: hypothetical protein U1F67_10375 [Rubrivivax sp.]
MTPDATHAPAATAAGVPFTYTVFASVSAIDKCDRRGTTWGGFCRVIAHGGGKTYASKKACPLLKAATFGDNANAKGSLRHDGNVADIFGVEGDHDEGTVSPAEAAARLRLAGIRAIIYTTPSHKAEKPRWRVIVPLSAPAAPALRHELVSQLNGALGGCLASESWVLSQTFYFGRVAGAPYEVHVVDGAPLDVYALAPTADAMGPTVAVRAPLAIDHRRQAVDRSHPEVAHLEAAGWVTGYRDDGAVDVRCPRGDMHSTDSGPSSTTWFPSGLNGRAAGGFECRHQSCGRPTTTEFMQATGLWALREAAVIAEFDEVSIDVAAEAEAALARMRNAPSARGIVDYLRTLSREAVLERWAGLAQLLQRDAAEEVLDEVQRITKVGMRPLRAALADARSAASAQRRADAVRAKAGKRQVIEYRPDERAKQADQVERAIVAAAKPGECVSFGSVLSHVVVRALPCTHQVDDTEAPPPPVPQIEPLDSEAMLRKVEAVAMFVETVDGVPRVLPVPDKVIAILVNGRDHSAPKVTGLVTHPIVLPHNGVILASDGLHAPTGLFLSGAGFVPSARPYTRAEAQAALQRLRDVFLEGFEFSTQLDADVALAGLLTGVQRRVLDAAPGLAVLASAQSSGKTTLARRLHILLTGQDMPVSSFPEGDEPEAQKRLLSVLLRSPAMVCFDNLTDGCTFRSAVVAAAMTSSVFQQRILGATRDAEAPTNTLFVLTGNNVGLGADEVSRWIVTRLAPAVARPEERTFANPDVVAHALAARAAVLGDVVGLIAGYLRSCESMPTATRFPRWDRAVRQPLVGGRQRHGRGIPRRLSRIR